MKVERLIIFFIILIIPIVYSIQCTIRQNNCQQGEVCLFSRYQPNNTHIGNCTAYPNNLTCCSDPYLTSASVKLSCSMGENGTISMFNWTNSHAEIYSAGNYQYKVCVDCAWVCTLRSTCLSDEYSIASLNATTNSHVGESGYYGNQVCCKREDTRPTSSNVGQNVSTPIQSQSAVKLYAYWTDNSKISYAILETNETGLWTNKSTYGSPMLINTNQSWSNFTWQNSSVPTGATVGWRIYANDTCNNWAVTSINTFQIQSISISISGNLSEGIFFTSLEGSKVNKQYDVNISTWNNATWNYNNTPSPGNYKTLYWIQNTGNVNEDFCMKANSDLICSQGPCTGVSIYINNVTWNNATINDQNTPSFDTTKRMSTSYTKIAYNVNVGSYIYLRFWLYVDIGKPSGIYNTTYSIRGVEAGTSC